MKHQLNEVKKFQKIAGILKEMYDEYDDPEPEWDDPNEWFYQVWELVSGKRLKKDRTETPRDPHQNRAISKFKEDYGDVDDQTLNAIRDKGEEILDFQKPGYDEYRKEAEDMWSSGDYPTEGAYYILTVAAEELDKQKEV